MGKVDALRRHALSILVIVLGIAASIIVNVAVRENRNSQANLAFTALASSRANLIVEGFSQTLFAIESVGALFGSSERISSSQFDDFVAPLLDRFPTITALGWAPQVHHNEREEFEQSARKLFPGFHITERNTQNEIVDSAERQIYFPVYFIRPYEGNEVAHGFDLHSNQVRRAAISRARDSGQTTSTARISLVQERGHSYSVLLIHPVFQNSGSGKDRGKLLGIASAVYRIGDGVEKALSQFISARMNILLFDRSAEPDKQFLYSNSLRNLGANQQITESMPPSNARQYVDKFNLGARNFELILTPASDYSELDEGYEAWLALVIGLGFTGLIAAYLELTFRRSQELISGQKALEQQINERIYAEQKLREANRNLEDLARKDPLMGIANRRYFDERFQQEWLRAARQGTALSLLIGDIDYFKNYNDTYGHPAGDRCLRKIARALADMVHRPDDLVARYGGEEIAIVLPSTTETGAYNIAEKVRLAVAAMALPHESSVSKMVTMSIGCGTTLVTQKTSMEDFIQAVDAALYRAKQQGRNKTVVDKTMN